jgi:hypothetical protein
VKREILAFWLLILVGALAAVPASADTVLYSDGTSTYAENAYSMQSTFAITDSFTLSQTSTITAADFGIWLGSGESLTSVEWAITTAAFGGTTEASGTANPTAGSLITTYSVPSDPPTIYDIYTETFSIPTLTLGPGTYYFQLGDAVSTTTPRITYPVAWDESGGPSTAYQYQDPGTVSVGGETFDILGTEDVAATPEPGSFLLLGSGLLAMAGLVRRKLAN